MNADDQSAETAAPPAASGGFRRSALLAWSCKIATMGHESVDALKTDLGRRF